MPKAATPGRPFVVRIAMPSNVAAVDGRLLFAHGAVDVWGIAPVSSGIALRPETVPGGVVFGAYDLHSLNGVTKIRIIAEASKPGRPWYARLNDRRYRHKEPAPRSGSGVVGRTHPRRRPGA